MVLEILITLKLYYIGRLKNVINDAITICKCQQTHNIVGKENEASNNDSVRSMKGHVK